MKKFLLAIAFLASVSAFAGELDNETTNAKRASLAQNLPQTLVVKMDNATGLVSVLHSQQALAPAKLTFEGESFIPMNATDKMSELDKDSSTSGWYFWWYNYSYYAPTYYYYGYYYYYQPYYSYYYNGCNYYWYRWYY